MRRLVIAATILMIPLEAAAVRGVRLSVPGDPATSVAIGWNSDAAGDVTVQYGTSPSALTMTATATATAQTSPLGTAYTAVLTGLTPDTTYFYKVGGAGGAFYPAGEPFQFRTLTADPCAPFRFIAIGDNRRDVDGAGENTMWKEILADAVTYAPAFFINTGDMVKNGDDAAEWSSFIDDSELGLALVASAAVIGNHDTDSVYGDGAKYNQLFEFPRNSAGGLEDYYAFDAGPIHIVGLNTQLGPTSTELAEMVAWLDADLAATDRPWKIAFFHKAMYSRGNHSTGEDDDGALNRAIIPVLDAHDVDLVFNGHSHDYERYAPSVGVDTAFGGAGRLLPAGNGGAIGAVVPDGATGTTYIVTGGGGALTTDLGLGYEWLTCIDAACTYCLGWNWNCPDDVLDLDRDATVVYDGRHNFVVLDVAEDTLTVTAHASGSSDVIDTFSMVKTAFDITCGTVVTPDGGLPVVDGGTTPVGDAPPGFADGPLGPTIDGPHQPGVDGGPGVTGGDASGCDCRVSGRRGPSPLWLALPGLLVTLRLRRRRRHAP